MLSMLRVVLFSLLAVLPCLAFAEDPPLDQLLLRNGFVALDFTGTDTSVGSSGLGLTSLGRWYDGRGVARYTLWRVRNINSTAQAVRLEGPNAEFSLSFSARPRSDSYIRSPQALSAASHKLWNGTTVLDTQAAGNAQWSDSTLVAPSTGSNRAPSFLSSAPLIAEVGDRYRYAPIVDDPDRDLLTLTAPTAPTGLVIDTSLGVQFTAGATQVGLRPVTLRASDGRGGSVDQGFSLRVLTDYCPIYPIALPDALLANANAGQSFAQIRSGQGAGQFTWLTWAGSPNSPTLAQSLVAPGDSYTYSHPDNAADHLLESGDWAQGASGSMNSSAVRDALSALLQKDIVLLTWNSVRGTGNEFDYRAARFARVRLNAFELTGQGALSFTFQGFENCYSDAPVAFDQAIQTQRDMPVAVTLSAIDAEGDALSFVITQAPSHGTLSGTAPNLTYTPAAGYVGTDRIAFTASDGQRVSEPGLIDITITPRPNQAPDAHAQQLTSNEDLALSLTLDGSDPDGDNLSFEVVREPAYGTLSGTAPQLTYTPTADFNGVDSFEFRVGDGVLFSEPATVGLNIVAINDAPSAVAQELTGAEDSALAITLGGTDIDADVLSFRVSTPPAHGSLSGSAPNLTYTPAANFNGSDELHFVVNDGSVDSAPASVRLNIFPVNDHPSITSTAPTSAQAGTPYHYDVQASDVDGDTLSYALLEKPAGATINTSDGTIAWTPSAAQSGSHNFKVEVSDGHGGSVQQTFSVSVSNQNTAPTITSLPATSVGLGAPYQYDLAASDADAGDTLSYSLTRSPAAMTINATSGPIGWTGASANPLGLTSANASCEASAESTYSDSLSVDLVVLMDESGSMDGDQAWMRDFLPQLDSALRMRGVGAAEVANRYGLIGFGKGNSGITTVYTTSDGAKLYSMPSWYTLTRKLVAAGEFEDAYPGLNAIADSYPLNDQAAHNVILVTDDFREARSAHTYASTLAALQSKDIVLNAVLAFVKFTCADGSPSMGLDSRGLGYVPDGAGGYRTCANARYVPIEARQTEQVNLALASGGAVWSLEYLRNGGPNAISFTKMLREIKVREIVDSLPRVAQADLAISELRAPIGDGSATTLDLVIANRGLEGVVAPVHLTATDPASGVNLGSATLSTGLAAGASATQTLALTRPLRELAAIRVAITVDNTVSECTVSNNMVEAPLVGAQVRDAGGLSAAQWWLLAVAERNDAPSFDSTPVQSASVGVRYNYLAHAVDADAGDNLRYRLLEGPGELQLDAVTGLLSVRPKETLVGTHNVAIEVRDLAGATAEQRFTWTVAAAETYDPILITSTAPNPARLPQRYEYAVTASADPDATLSFELGEAPSGASIDSVSGLITWDIPATELGKSHYFVVIVRDQFLQVAMQEFRLDVDKANVAPEITRAYTQLVTTTVTGYGFTALFSDSNPFDVLRWTLLKKPVGASIDEISSQVHWTVPTPAPETGFVDSNLLFDAICPVPGARVDGIRGAQRWRVTGTAWSQPVVAALTDANGDGLVNDADPATLIVVDGSANLVRAFNAADGSVLWTVNAAERLSQDVAPAIADIDADGSPEILVYGGSATQHYLLALNADGTRQWQSSVSPTTGVLVDSAILVVDLDADTHAEILIGPAIFDAAGQRLRLLATSVTRGYATPVDIDLDGRYEILFGAQLFNADGSVRWNYTHSDGTAIFRAAAGVGNFDADANPEIVLVTTPNEFGSGANRVVIVDNSGSRLWAPLPLLTFGGVPVIADMDDDGRADIYLATESLLIDAGGQTLWSRSRDGERSAVAADLNGNGAYEIIENARGVNSRWRVASTGESLDFPRPAGAASASIPSGPPLVIDLDGDGDAELVFGSDTGIVAYNAQSGRWLGGAKAVKQRLFTLADAPAAPSGNTFYALARNEFQVTLPRNTTAQSLPDIWVSAPLTTVDTTSATLSFEVVNRGPLAVRAPFVVSLRSGNAGSVGVELQRMTISALRAGERRALSFTLPAWADAPAELYLSADHDNVVAECEERNNKTLTALFQARVTDSGGLFDEERFGIRYRTQLANPVLNSTPVLQAEEGLPYSYTLRLTTQAVSNQYLYRLVNGPAGMDVHPNTGVVSWLPVRGTAGNYAVSLEVVGLQLNPVTQSFTLNVRPGSNQAPVITSSPVTSATVAVAYAYDVNATDANNDTLSYALSQWPAGMTINATTGVIAWTPTAGQAGAQAVVVSVDDGRGPVTQSFIVTVAPAATNRAPVINSAPANVAKVGREYVYAVAASDADGDTLAYSLPQAPPGMSISPTGTIRWTPGAVGTVQVSVRVADASAFVEQSYPINVVAADVPLSVSVVVTPTIVAAGGTVEVTIGTAGAAGPITVTATLNGAPITLAPDATTPLTAPTTPGRYTLVVALGDGYDTTTETVEFFVSDPNDADAPVVELLSPADAAEITAPTPVRGSVNDTHLANWLLALRPANSPEAAPTILAQGNNTFTDQAFADFDPTLLINGQYSLILQATDTSGRSSSDSVVLRVTGDMKVGNFSITFEDVNLPLAGIPISVSRTYDTRQRNEELDFGYGWSVDYQNVRVRESRKLGLSWALHKLEGGIIDRWCVLANGDPTVTVTLPDGQVETFRARAEPECRDLAPEINVNLVFQAIDGTDTTLEQTTYGLLRLTETTENVVANLIDPDAPSVPIDPRNYRLTTVEGLVYDLDQNFGVKKITELNGNTLTYSNTGILHSSGIGVIFHRDTQNRITDIELPDGEMLSYTYTPNGDLEAKADELNQLTRFAYEPAAAFAHYLKDIIDPRGVRAIRNEYNAEGRLVATVDADGKRIEYTHDIAGRTEHVKDRRGFASLFEYDDNGWVLSQTNALNETTRHSYDADGNELTTTDALNHTTTRTFDQRGNALTVRNARGETTTSTYDARNALLTQKDGRGVTVMTNTYHPGTGALVEAKDALNRATTFNYDSGIGSGNTGEVLDVTDALGQQTFYLVNLENGYRVAETNPLGHRTSYTHDASGRVLTETRTRTDANGNTATLVSRRTYDAKGRVTRTALPDGSFNTTEYNAIDKPVRQCDSENRCVEQIYDNRGNVTETRYPDGSSESRVFDPNDNVIAETNRLGQTTKFVFDAANRLVETIFHDATPATDADNPRMVGEYDPAGRVIASIDTGGQRTSFGYDDANRRTTVTDALGNTTRTEYDSAGRRTAMIDARGQRTTLRYDDAGRLLESTFANGSSAKTEFDALGRKTAEIDQAAKRTEFSYDALSRLTDVRQTIAGVTLTTRYAYDELNNKVRQTDAKGQVTRWTFDAVGRELSRTLPNATTETFEYDTLGRRTAHVDFKGQRTTFAYNTNDQLIRTSYADGRVDEQSVDVLGRRLSLNSAEGAFAWVYDARNRLVRETQPNGVAFDYEYDLVGNRTLVRDSEGAQSTETRFTFDVLNRLTSAQEGNAAPIVYGYDAVGNRTSETQGQVATVYTFDNLNRLVEVHSTQAGATRQRYRYTLDASGRHSRIEETDATGGTHLTDYGHDDLNRLTSEAETVNGQVVRSASFAYDEVGNRTRVIENGVTRTATFDVNDRLLSQDGETFGYDANGNQTSKTAAAGTVAYVYDARNKLIRANDSANGAQMSFVYDADGNRIERREKANAAAPEVLTRFVVDRNRDLPEVVAELDASGTITARYLHALDLVQQTTIAGGAPSINYPLRDGLGSTRYLADTTGAAIDTFRFDAWGQEVDRIGTTPTAHRFAGEMWEPALGLSFNRARWYSPSQARFTQMDQWRGCAECPISQNKYIYANDAPIDRIDPTGYYGTGADVAAAPSVLAIMVSSSVAAYGRVLLVGGGLLAFESVTEWVGGKLGFPAVHTMTSIYALRAAERVREESRAGTLAVAASVPQTDGHHPIPVYLCGAMNQEPRVQISRAQHIVLHSELYAWRLGVEQVLDTQFRVHYPIFSLRNRGELPTETSAGWGVRALASSSSGRAYIGSLLDMFYATGWYGTLPMLETRFQEERPQFVSGAKTSLGINCARPPRS